MIKLKKKRNNPNSVEAYVDFKCGCPFGCSSCGCSCPPTGISTGTVQNLASDSPSYQNAPMGTENYR